MDIKNLISSTVKGSNTDTYFVQFPSFTGYVEAVFYNHDSITLREGSDEVTPIFQTKKFYHDTHTLILVSRFFWHLWVRIFDTDRIFDEKIFIILWGELFSFEIMGKPYFSLVYRNTEGELDFYTNLESSLPFRIHIENNTFSIENTNFWSIVFTELLEFVEINTTHQSKPKEKIDSQKIFYIPDSLFSQSSMIIHDFLISQNQREYTEGILSCDFSDMNEHEFLRSVWFLGQYTTLLSESLPGIHGYKTIQDVSDGVFTMPSEFRESENMNALDQRWHTLRLSLLEIEYLLFSLKESLKKIENWIEAIDKLENVHILSQRKRLSLNEEEIHAILPKYQYMKDLLVSSLKTKLHY